MHANARLPVRGGNTRAGRYTNRQNGMLGFGELRVRLTAGSQSPALGGGSTNTAALQFCFKRAGYFSGYVRKAKRKMRGTGIQKLLCGRKQPQAHRVGEKQAGKSRDARKEK